MNSKTIEIVSREDNYKIGSLNDNMCKKRQGKVWFGAARFSEQSRRHEKCHWFCSTWTEAL